jgi:lipopolysaccharide export system protein LptA
LLITITNNSYASKTRLTEGLTTSYTLDTLIHADTIVRKDTLLKPVSKKSFIDEKVEYSADDSILVDKDKKKAYLYNNAVVTYDNMKLTAGYIEIDFGKNIVYSSGIKDSTGKITQKPISEQDGEKFTAGEITYNFKTKKGKIKDVITQQGEGYIHGGGIKKDSSNTFYVAHGKYTTCDLEHPHFYIGAKKIKVIPDDKIVTGPAQLVIMDVPTPLVIPFGYFPNKKGRASGILVPTYGESKVWGFNLQNGGYYFGNNEYVDLALRGDIYSNGSFAVRAQSNYKLRYKYNGMVGLNYAYMINGNPQFVTTTRTPSYSIRWSHNQDSKANPGSVFSANVNMVSALYNKYNGNVSNGQYTTNTLQSKISYSKKLGSNFNFSANAMQSQNTILKQSTYELPNLALTMNRIFPFKNDNKVGNAWYDKIGVSASANAKNTITQYDSILYSEKMIQKNIRQTNNGLQVNIPISTSLNLLKYFTLNPSINTSGFLYTKTIEKKYNPLQNTVKTDTINGMRMAAQYNFATSLKTLMYGNYFFKTKRLKQIRHVITPALNLSYTPDFSEKQYGYYKKVQQDSLGNTVLYSPFQNGIFGGPTGGEQGLIGFSVNNTLEAKVKKQTDSGSVAQKVMILQNFSFAANYNAAAKAYNWSNISLSGRTKLFKLLDVNSTATLDPYQVDANNKRIEKYEWNNNRIGRLTSWTAALGASFKSKEKTKGKSKTKDDSAHADELEYIRTHPNAYVDFNVPWNLNVSYNYSFNKQSGVGVKPTTAQAITIRGDLSVTQKWKISMNSGFDLEAKKISLTSISIHRDLHCWEMNFNWIPFGLRQSYTLTLNVKSSVLQDLRIQRKGNWQDYQY